MKLYCFRGYRVVGWGSLEAWKNEYLQAKKEGSPVQRMMGQLGVAISWDDAFTRRFDFDAMICPYYRRDLPDAPRFPRMSGAALNNPDLLVGSAWIDVDNPGHARWQTADHARKGVDEVLAKLPADLRDTVYWYATRGGVRLVWRLAEPVEARHWRSWMSQFRTMLSAHGIHTDECSEEYARHFRLPLVRRDGADLDLPVGEVGHQGTLSWEPPADVTVETVSEGADPSQWSDQHPPFDPEKDTPKASDYTPLKDSEWHEPLTQPSPLGVPGERHRQIRRCVCSITAMLRSEEPARIFKLVAPSVLADKSPDAPGLRELWDLCRWACSAQKAERIGLEGIRNTIFARARQATTTQTDGDEPVDEDEYDASKDDVRERIVLIIEKAHYVLHEDTGQYFGPVGRDSVYIALRQVSPSLYSLAYTNQGKKIPVNNFLERHARIVDSVVAKVGETGIRYNVVTDQIIEGICAIRSDLSPAYHAEIHEWLEHLGGTEKDRLLDWLATLTDLDWPTCALYIEGPKSIGKGMLADGIASLWGSKPATWTDFTASFNDQLSRVPLVWADEKIPSDRFASQEASITLRQMVGNSSFTLKRKYLPSQSVTGCLRFLITANDGDALRLHEEMNRESYLAVVERIGHIKAGPQAAKYLEANGGRAFTAEWVSGDLIAQHLLWLRDNRSVTRGTRFIVPGWESTHHVHLRGASRTARSLLDAICTHLDGDSPNPEGLWIGDGRMLLTQKAAKVLMVANTPFNTPEHKALSRTLGSLGDEKGRIRYSKTSKRFRAYSINRWLVIEHAKTIDADFEKIEEVFDEPIDPDLIWTPDAT